MDKTMSKSPSSVLNTLLSEKSACTPSGEVGTTRYDAPHSLVVGNYTIQPLPEISFLQADGASLVEADAMEHKR